MSAYASHGFVRIKCAGIALAVAGSLIWLSGCASDGQLAVADQYSSQYQCPVGILTTDEHGVQSKWLGGSNAMCKVQNLSTGVIVAKLYTFLRVDAESDSAGEIMNPNEVRASIGAALLGNETQVKFQEERIFRGFEQFRPSFSRATFTFIKTYSYSLDNDLTVSSRIFRYSDIYQSRRVKGEWNVTFIDLKGSPFALKWEQTREGDAYQSVNDRAAPPFAIVSIKEVPN